MQAEEMLEEVAGYLHGYLKSGTVKINSFLSKMNVNISNIEQLLTIRFLLKQDTIHFVERLPHLLKHYKTTTTMQRDVNIGEVRGQIDWQQTLTMRMATNPKDDTIFVTNEHIRSYTTPENLVLKELLKTLYDILFTNNYVQGFDNADWFVAWKALKANVYQAYRKNIYIQRVENVHVSNRVLQKTLSHRSELYRSAAELLLNYRRLMEGMFNSDEIKQLLRDTFIAPNNVDVLFELYWIVQLIQANTEDSMLYLMDGKTNMVASWKKDSNIYRLYHDSSGSDSVDFFISSDEIASSNNPYLQQRYQSLQTYHTLVNHFLGKSSKDAFWQGRPDFLIEVIDQRSNELKQLVIGEVKRTASVSYAMKGLGELVDYMYLGKTHKGDYLMNSTVHVSGMLCTGDIPVKNEMDQDVTVFTTLSNRKMLEI